MGSAHRPKPRSSTGLGGVATVADDVGTRLPESASSGSRSQEAPPIPAELESLHEEVLRQLQTEAQAEASVEGLKAEIQSQRSSVSKRRSRLSYLEGSTAEKREALRSLSTRTADKTTIVEELRARRAAVTRKCSASDEALRQTEMRLEVLRQQRKNLEKQSMDLSREVLGLVDMLGQMRRAMARGTREEQGNNA